VTKPARISYAFVIGAFLLVGVLRLGGPMLAALFSSFALNKLHFIKNKWLAVSLFLFFLLGIAYGLGYFANQLRLALPKVMAKAIPSIIAYAEEKRVELPFTDLESLKAFALDTAKDQIQYFGNFANLAKGATRQVVFLIVGIVVAVSLFFNSQFDLDRASHPIRNNLYSLTGEEIAKRFQLFFRSFTTVMGAQIVVSAINTVLTLIFVVAVSLPHALVVVGVTFLCGLLPLIGNLISNTIIVCVSFTVSPKMALVALIFLIVIHKLEYFLNSKIIGNRIRNPIWLTLIALILGERLMGIPGMILAPVLLHYLKQETLKIKVEPNGAPPS
jgi:predicted PurR-regulated permease PerM